MATSSDPARETVTTVCCHCGREADAVIDGQGWCVDCFHARGSCCAGEFEPEEDPGDDPHQTRREP